MLVVAPGITVHLVASSMIIVILVAIITEHTFLLHQVEFCVTALSEGIMIPTRLNMSL